MPEATFHTIRSWNCGRVALPAMYFFFQLLAMPADALEDGLARTPPMGWNRGCSTFESDVGVDDEVGSNGSVIFQVWGDGVKFFDSGLMTGGVQRQSVSLDVSSVNEMRLMVGAGPDDMNYDHADWANARLTCGP